MSQFETDLDELVATGFNDLEAQHIIKVSPNGMVMDVAWHATAESSVRGEFRKSNRDAFLIFVAGLLGQRQSERPMSFQSIKEAMAERNFIALPEIAFAGREVFYRFLGGIRACLLAESFACGRVHLVEDEEEKPRLSRTG